MPEKRTNMDDRKSALLWQFMQQAMGAGSESTESHNSQWGEYSNTENHPQNGMEWQREMLNSLRPMLSTQQQRQIDLLIKMLELKQLMTEMHFTNTL